MHALFRDSAAGQFLRPFTRNRLALYADEAPSFELPEDYSHSTTSSTDQVETNDDGKLNRTEKTQLPEAGVDTGVLPDEEKATELDPTKNSISVVDWYSDNDPDNPHNWLLAKKLYVGILLLIYTISVYIGSSTYTASEEDVVQIFHVSDIAAALGLSLYVIAYGIGPLLFAPLSEIPAIGRNPIYIATYIIFVALTLAASLVNNFGGLLVLRFLLGFFGSPCLANAGASYGDFFGPKAMPYVIALWGGGATLSPVRLARPMHIERKL